MSAGESEASLGFFRLPVLGEGDKAISALGMLSLTLGGVAIIRVKDTNKKNLTRGHRTKKQTFITNTPSPLAHPTREGSVQYRTKKQTFITNTPSPLAHPTREGSVQYRHACLGKPKLPACGYQCSQVSAYSLPIQF
ncbi:UNVERIFIED_CONTAM: hypothetical protein FKN15_032868 [Acipenser sinensis]